ncbi:MAG: hypothetical protein QM756_41025 [Polyangiaceae bacterium]
MFSQKVQIKLFASADAHTEAYVPVFHRWIRENVLNELMIDVVDYSHVAHGPEVVLLGHGFRLHARPRRGAPRPALFMQARARKRAKARSCPRFVGPCALRACSLPSLA